MSLRLGRDVMSCIAEPVMENKDGIGAALEGTLAPLAGALGTLHELVQNTFQKVFQAYEEYVEPAFDSISGGLSTVFAGALEAYNSYLAPVLGWVSERFSLLVSEYIQPLIDAFVEFGGKAVGALSMLWDFLSPFVSWFVEKLVAQIYQDVSGHGSCQCCSGRCRNSGADAYISFYKIREEKNYEEQKLG